MITALAFLVLTMSMAYGVRRGYRKSRAQAHRKAKGNRPANWVDRDEL